MSLLRVQWLLLKRHTNRCAHTHTHIYLSHLFTGDLGNDGRLNVADGTSHSIQILFFFSTLSRSFKKSVQGQASSVNRAGIWFQIRRQNEGAHEVLSDVRKPSATQGFFFSFWGHVNPWRCCRVAWEGARGVSRHPLNFLRGGYQRAEASSNSVWWQAF